MYVLIQNKLALLIILHNYFKMKKFLVPILFVLVACNEPAKENAQVKDTTKAKEPIAQKQPITSVEKTKVAQQYFMVKKDSAKTPDEVGQKLGTIFGEIGKCAKDCGMEMTGAPVAWYNGPTGPWVFEAGAPFKNTCKKPSKGIYNKEIKAGNAVVCHFFGPYTDMKVGYEAAQNYIAEQKLQVNGAPWEVYVGDPMIVKDPYKVQTDIYFPIK